MFAAVPETLVESSYATDLANILGSIGEAVAYVDSTWTVQYCNDVYLANVGLRRNEVIGHTPFEFAAGFKRSIFYEAFEDCRATRSPTMRIGFSTVLNRWLMVRVFPMGSGVVMMANDASEGIVKQRQLAQKAVLDPLTGLGNKLAMEQFVSNLIHRDETFAMTIIGVDRFKEVNDVHGYAFGDMVLLELASLLQSSTVAGETLFRLSGDEFAVIHGDARDNVAERAAIFLEAVRKPIVRSDCRVVLSACAGVATCPADGNDYDMLLKHACLALREAKRSGRESVSSYRTELELASRMRAQIEAELRAAIDGSQFVLQIQPKISLATGAVIGGEALIRWAHPKRGLQAPGAFLGIAQEIGMMIAIDQWVLRAALKSISKIRATGMAVPISINLSVDSLSDMYLVERVKDALSDEKVAPELLEVEIPEGTLMRDVETSSRVLSALHQMGVRISIDDFGTGYSSFAYLAQFPVHSLKIDRSFVKDIESNDNSRTIVKSIVRLSHSLSLDVVAEGAESLEQLNILRRMKCDSVQGYAVARPLPFNEFLEFATQNQGDKGPSAMTI
jgi:diguanylate cyclase